MSRVNMIKVSFADSINERVEDNISNFVLN